MQGKNNISVFAYLRVSSNGQVKGHGFQRQEETISGFASENGYAVTETFRDAFTGTEADRPEFNRMVATILGNGVRTILVESLDRLARDVMVQSLLLAKLAQHHITLINCVTGEDVTASMSEDPMRKALIQIQSVFSELEKSRLVSKLRRARGAKKEGTGKREGGKKQFSPFFLFVQEEFSKRKSAAAAEPESKAIFNRGMRPRWRHLAVWMRERLTARE